MTTGLTSTEASRRLAAHGPNTLPQPAPQRAWMRWLRQFRSPLVGVLLLAVFVSVAVWLHDGGHGVPVDAIIIAIVLVANAALSVLQEQRSEAALARLHALAAPQSWVLRDGVFGRRPSAELVTGDVVRLEAGERVPADAMLLEAHGFAVDEAVLTGESLPVEKGSGDAVLSGTLAVRGTALAAITATGADSHMGRLAAQVGRITLGSTPLERRLDEFGGRIARWVVAIAAAVIIAGLAARGMRAFDEVLLFSLALAVAAVPEGLPAVVALTLALGVQRMAHRSAVVRRLQAVEALGSVTVIATDKTGTLTQNRVVVGALDAVERPAALAALVFANEADPFTQGGDPLDRALFEFARGAGVDPAALRAACPCVSRRPFDSAWKCMRSTVVEGGRRVGYWKGASEVILARAALSAEERDAWSRRAAARADAGNRVLGLARGDDESEEGLQFLGLVSLWDPPRPEAQAALRDARDAGVRVVMITGDHPGTARAIAQQLGIARADDVMMTGPEIDGLGAAELVEIARRCPVFARVNPEHKLRLVEALRADGQIVAVTGDGVNDAPALKRADVGVAMGLQGSDVAREVSDLVLLDDDFATIVAAIREGRGIYANIEKFVRFMLSTNVGGMMLIVGGTVGAWALGLREASGALFLPLTAVQILWINFFTDGPPALAIGVDRNLDLMRTPPRPPASPLLDPPSLRFVLISGAFKAAIAGALLVGLPQIGTSLMAARTAVFLHTTLAQLLFVYPSRRLSGRTEANLALHAAIAIAIALQIATVVVPPLRSALGLVALGAHEMLLVVAAVALTWAGAEGILRMARRAH